jgi:hypothetical protein
MLLEPVRADFLETNHEDIKEHKLKSAMGPMGKNIAVNLHKTNCGQLS